MNLSRPKFFLENAMVWEKSKTTKEKEIHTSIWSAKKKNYNIDWEKSSKLTGFRASRVVPQCLELRSRHKYSSGLSSCSKALATSLNLRLNLLNKKNSVPIELDFRGGQRVNGWARFWYSSIDFYLSFCFNIC